MQRYLVRFSLCLLILLAGFSTIMAQEQPPVPLPDPHAQACLATYQSELESIAIERRDDKLSDFVVVYLVSDQLDANNVLAATNVREEVPDIQVVTAWDDFLAIDTVTPIETVFIHKSALDIADPEWFQDAYRRAVSMFFININFGEYADLVGDYCTFAAHAAEGPLGGNPATFELDSVDYYIQSLWLLKTEAQYTSQISEAELMTCKEKSVKDLPYALRANYGFDFLSSIESLFRLGISAGTIEEERKFDEAGQRWIACLAADKE